MQVRNDALIPTRSLPSAADGNAGGAFDMVYAASLGTTIEIDTLGGGLLGTQATGGQSPANVASNNLRRALRAYGISLPPPMRIDDDANGKLGLENDPRNARFQTMLGELPELAGQLNTVLSDTATQRTADFASACQQFSQHRDPHITRAVIDHYIETHPDPPLSLVYNGQNLTPQEKSGDGWRPVKTTTEFLWELTREADKYVTVQDQRFDALMKAVSGKHATPAGQQGDDKPSTKDGKGTGNVLDPSRRGRI